MKRTWAGLSPDERNTVIRSYMEAQSPSEWVFDIIEAMIGGESMTFDWKDVAEKFDGSDAEDQADQLA